LVRRWAKTGFGAAGDGAGEILRRLVSDFLARPEVGGRDGRGVRPESAPRLARQLFIKRLARSRETRKLMQSAGAKARAVVKLT